ncbi:MAG: transporter [Pseudomonadota bacterium]
MNTTLTTFIPVLAVLVGACICIHFRPGPRLVSAIQHLAAGVVFAAAAVEILPQILHAGSVAATFIGGAAGVCAMLALKALGKRWQGPVGLLGAVSIDLFIDGLVLGLAFIAGERAGILLTIALTLEVFFLGLTVTQAVEQRVRSKVGVVLLTGAIALSLPLGALLSAPVGSLPPAVVAAFLAFGLMALLYLVTEELLVEAHEIPDTPLVSAMFFVGFLGLLLIEEGLAQRAG